MILVRILNVVKFSSVNLFNFFFLKKKTNFFLFKFPPPPPLLKFSAMCTLHCHRSTYVFFIPSLSLTLTRLIKATYHDFLVFGACRLNGKSLMFMACLFRALLSSSPQLFFSLLSLSITLFFSLSILKCFYTHNHFSFLGKLFFLTSSEREKKKRAIETVKIINISILVIPIYVWCILAVHWEQITTEQQQQHQQ